MRILYRRSASLPLVALCLLMLTPSSLLAQNEPTGRAEVRERIVQVQTLLGDPGATQQGVTQALSPLSSVAADYFNSKKLGFQSSSEGFDKLSSSMSSLQLELKDFTDDAFRHKDFNPGKITEFKARIAEVKAIFSKLDSQILAERNETRETSEELILVESAHLNRRGEPIEPAVRTKLLPPEELDEAIASGMRLRGSTEAAILLLEERIAKLDARFAATDVIPLGSYAAPLFTDDAEEYKAPVPKEARIDPLTSYLEGFTDLGQRLEVGRTVIGHYAHCVMNSRTAIFEETTKLEFFKGEVAKAIAAARRGAHADSEKLVSTILKTPESTDEDLKRILVPGDVKVSDTYFDLVGQASQTLFEASLVLDATDQTAPKPLEGDGCNAVDFAMLRQVNAPRGAETRATVIHVDPLSFTRAIKILTDAIILQEVSALNVKTDPLYALADGAKRAGDRETHERTARIIQEYKQKTLKAITDRTAALFAPFEPVRQALEQVELITAEALLAMHRSYFRTLNDEIQSLGKKTVKDLGAVNQLRAGALDGWKDLGFVGGVFYDGTEDRDLLRQFTKTSASAYRLKDSVESMRFICRDRQENCAAQNLRSREELYTNYKKALEDIEYFYESLDNSSKQYQAFRTELAASRARVKFIVALGSTAVALGATIGTGGGASPLLVGAALLFTDVAVAGSFAAADGYFGRPSDSIAKDFKADVAVAVVSAGTGAGVVKLWSSTVSRMALIQRLEAGAISRLPVYVVEGAVNGAARSTTGFLTRFYVYHERFPSSEAELRAFGNSVLLGTAFGAVFSSAARTATVFYSMASEGRKLARQKLAMLKEQSLGKPISIKIEKGAKSEEKLNEFLKKADAANAPPGTLFLAITTAENWFNRRFRIAHWQVIFKNNDGVWERIHASPLARLHTAPIGKMQTDRGVFFKVDIADKQREALLKMADGLRKGKACDTPVLERTLMSGCTEGACQILRRIGVHAGNTRPTASGNVNLYNLLTHGFVDSTGKALKTSVYTTGDRTLPGLFTPTGNYGVTSTDVVVPALFGYLGGGVAAGLTTVGVRATTGENIMQSNFLVWPIGIGHWALRPTIDAKPDFFVIPPIEPVEISRPR